MLPEIAAEAVQFLNRRDLDKTCGVSKWLDVMIAQCFEEYPLRLVFSVTLFPSGNGFTLQVRAAAVNSGRHHLFDTMEEAAHFARSILRNSYVETLQLGEHSAGSMPLLPCNWTTLIDTIRNGAVWRLRCINVDCSALDDDAFLVAAGCRGLKSLCVGLSVVPPGLVTDDLIRSCSANGLLELCFASNRSHTLPRFSDHALLDFYFPVGASAGEPPRRLELARAGISDMFLAKFFERLLQSPFRPSGCLEFYGAARQRGLSAYAQYLAYLATYRFPAMGANKESYEVELWEHSTHTLVRFSLVPRSF